MAENNVYRCIHALSLSSSDIFSGHFFLNFEFFPQAAEKIT